LYSISPQSGEKDDHHRQKQEKRPKHQYWEEVFHALKSSQGGATLLGVSAKFL
jgi:hypothetical protein